MATYLDNKPINQNGDIVAQLQPKAYIFHIQTEEILVNLCFNYLLSFNFIFSKFCFIDQTIL